MADSIPDQQEDTLRHNLAEVVVAGKTMIDKSDRKLLIPTGEAKAQSANGVELLQRMQVPRIVVDRLNDEIKLSGGGQLSIRINGRTASVNDLKSLAPGDIKRVEYHENPSMRYGDADAVLDFIVRHEESGGSLVAAGQQSFLMRMGDYNVGLKLNRGYSQFGVSGGYHLREDFDIWRENTEHYALPDGTRFERQESGLPGLLNASGGWVNLDYSYSRPDGSLFFAQVGLYATPERTERFDGLLSDTWTEQPLLVHDETRKKAFRPSVNLYWQHNLDKQQSLAAEVVLAYNENNSRRDYDTWLAADSSRMSDIRNHINSDTWSATVDFNYEHHWKAGRLTAGAKYSQEWSDNRYLSTAAREKPRDLKTMAYGEWWQPLGGHFDYTASLALKQRAYRLSGMDATNTFDAVFQVNSRYRINDRNTLRLRLSTSTNTPSANDLSSALQSVDEFQKYRGNPTLKPSRLYVAELRYEYSAGRVYVDLNGMLRYSDKPIMEEKSWTEDASGNPFILNTVDNQRYHYTLRLTGFVKVTVVPEWLNVNAGLAWKHSLSRGHTYRHKMDALYAEWNVLLSHWNFTLAYSGCTNSRSLWGETLTGQENYQQLELSYRYHDLTVGIGVFNPFMKNYNIPSHNYNEYAGYDRKVHLRNSQNVGVITVSYNIEWGKQRNVNKRLNNNYDGSGAVNAVGK